MFDIITQHGFAFYFGVSIVFFAFMCMLRKDMDVELKGALVIVALGWLFFVPIFSLLGLGDKDARDIGIPKAGALAIFLVSITIYAYHELTLSPDERVARAEQQFQLEKEELEEAHRQEIKEAQAQVKLAEIEAKRLALYNDSTKNEEHVQEIEKAKAKLKTIQAQGVDYSKLSQPEMSSASPSTPQGPGAPVDEQRRLVLSGLWLGACFFLQRVFEKLFKDKGYALLTVCAAGFLLAFFTANYFLLGGSVTGGLMGAAGNRT